jgi:hypothetical protein
MEARALLGEGKMVHLLWKTIWWYLKKLNIELSYAPENLLSGHIPKDLFSLLFCLFVFVILVCELRALHLLATSSTA